jgi:uncharacterized protein
MESVLVAFSGGVDSALVLAVAHSVLGDKVLAVTADSPSLPRNELEETRQLAQSLGVRHRIVQTQEMNSPNYNQNPVDRCYYCKSELYSRLQEIAQETGSRHILNGTNTDDLGDYRPGLKSAEEKGIRSPLWEAGFNKEDVRSLAKEMGLSLWNKPAAACLSSRIPYGQPVTRKKLSMIEQAENFLKLRGYRQVRVRHHGELARIELGQEDLKRFMARETDSSVSMQLMEFGFQNVTLDLKGYRTGSLNEELALKSEAGKSRV